MGGEIKLSGPNLLNGVALEDFTAKEKILGHFEGNPVLLIKKENEFFAISGLCTHYSGNLNDGLLTGESIHCPLHHACFDIRTGRALKAPALNALQTWKTEVSEGRVYVRGPLLDTFNTDKPDKPVKPATNSSEHFVIVGSGAAGHAAAETLRDEGFTGQLSIFTADSDLPYDRPNISKDYLAGNAPEEWIPLRAPEFYKEKNINIHLSAPVEKVESEKKQILFKDKRPPVSFDKCLIATGGSPRTLNVPGADLPHVRYLRTLADSRNIIKSLSGVKNAVIIGSGFIGLECAASLRARKIEVTVISNENAPLLKILGPDAAQLVQNVHEKNGVKFFFQNSVSNIEPGSVSLTDGRKIPSDLVIAGIGIELNVSVFSERVSDQDGITVDEYLNTGHKDIFAAGDIASFPSVLSEKSIRAEHWVIAQWLGQTAAKNMLGQAVKFKSVPFFWSVQYDFSFSYIGSAKNWSDAKAYGSLQKSKFAVAYVENEKISAVLTVGLDHENLLIEQALERGEQRAIQEILNRIEKHER
jgi:NADPH-dependent 2,4-dienoyl-CoA reductase/sulfur reductase-like enzyme/nitrite reductase/ring-hydroxylating ferredoxin subunit